MRHNIRFILLSPCLLLATPLYASTIYGRVSGVGDQPVTLTFSGAVTAHVTTNHAGQYSISLPNGRYSISVVGREPCSSQTFSIDVPVRHDFSC